MKGGAHRFLSVHTLDMISMHIGVGEANCLLLSDHDICSVLTCTDLLINSQYCSLKSCTCLLQACFRPLSDASTFVILYMVTSVYFSGVMVCPSTRILLPFQYFTEGDC